MKKAVFIPIVILLVLSGSSVFATTDADGDSERKALSDSLFAAGVDLYDMQRYDEAVALFAESDRIDKAILDSTSNRRDYSAMWLASCLYRLGDSVKAAEISPEYYRIQPVDRRLTVHSDSMSAIGMEYYNSENYTLALETFRNVSEIEKSVVGDCHIWYGNTVGTIARLYHLMSDSANAIMEFERYVDIVGVSFSKYGDVYLSAVGECAWACATLKDYERAIKYGLIAFDIADSFGLDSQKCDYAYFLAENYNKIGLSLSGKDERKYYQNALSYLNYCNPIDSNVVEFQKVIESNIGASFSAEAFENYKIGNYTEAIRLETDAKEILARVLGTEHPDYATSLNNLAGYNSSIGNYTEAIRLGTEAMEIRARVLGTEHPNYATTLSNLAFYNTSICNYTEAIRLGTEAMEIRARVLGTEHPNYATTLSNLANYNSSMGNYTEAIRLSTEAKEIYARVLGTEHPDYATTLNNLANYNSSMGNYTEAIRLGTDAKEIRARVLGTEHPDYATTLNNLANYNSSIGNYTEAIRLGTDAKEIRARVLGTEHPSYAVSLGSLAGYNSSIGNYTEAIRLCTEAKEIFARVLGTEHPDYATTLNGLSDYNSSIGNYTEAIQMETDAKEIFAHVLGTKHPYYTLCLSFLAADCFLGGDVSLDRYVREATDGNMGYVRRMFGGMTAWERANLWNTKEKWFNVALPTFAYKMASDTAVECAVNGALMSKGLLLNSEIEMSKMLLESGDTTAVARYEELRLNKMMLTKLYEKPIAERMLDTDSIEAVIDRQERELVGMSRVYGDYTRNLTIDWRQVQSRLGERDAAVEFVRFPVWKTDSVMYAAYVTRRGWRLPKMIPLFEETEWARMDDFEYADGRMSELVWKPLAEELVGVERVFFAPAGELYNYAIEMIPDWEDSSRWISERWELHRLSSTRELALERGEPTGGRVPAAAVYGGLDYDKKERVEPLKESVKMPAAMYSEEHRARAWLADSLDLRHGVDALPGTRKEAIAIDRSLRDRKIVSKLLMDTIGTEGAFKAMSGERCKILHVATHGFYYTESEMRQMKHLDFQIFGDNRPRYVEDKAMSRSGLLMAGVNAALSGEDVPEGKDDGILTAKEISQLDLRGLDLVVLSACQTALGEVKGDGVFGLQRGFKKAGAQTILMSLWKVDDEATRMLMTRFYANLEIGMGKRAALQDAQRYVREYKVTEGVKEVCPYENPVYWAAFILLDDGEY